MVLVTPVLSFLIWSFRDRCEQDPGHGTESFCSWHGEQAGALCSGCHKAAWGEGMGGAGAMQEGPRLSWGQGTLEWRVHALTVPLTLIILGRAFLLQHASAPDEKEE